MIGIIFNHDFFDEPYKQSSVNGGLKKLGAIIQALNEHVFYSFGKQRVSLLGPDMDDEYVIVHHSCELTAEQKRELADAINETLTVKKNVYKKEQPEKLIVFEKKNAGEYFCY
jgi:hypothetical protein